MYELYEYCGEGFTERMPDEYMLKVFTPSFRHPLLSLENRTGHASDYHNVWVEIRWAIATLFRYQIYYVEKNGEIVHTSYCSPKCFKFPFMNRSDLHIGPCYTASSERGKGLYPWVLHQICCDKKSTKGTVYMLVEPENAASAAGVTKAGFVKTHSLKRSRIMRTYEFDDM